MLENGKCTFQDNDPSYILPEDEDEEFSGCDWMEEQAVRPEFAGGSGNIIM